MSHFRGGGAWQSLNFYKEYLFGFETLVFATSGILSMHKHLVTLQRVLKKNLKLHHMTPLRGSRRLNPPCPRTGPTWDLGP